MYLWQSPHRIHADIYQEVNLCIIRTTEHVQIDLEVLSRNELLYQGCHYDFFDGVKILNLPLKYGPVSSGTIVLVPYALCS